MAQQLADQRAAVLDSPRARDQWIETAGPAASRELGLIDGRVGQVHQPAGVGGVIGAGRDAGAVDAKAVDLDRPDRLADPLRDLEAGLRIRPGQEDPELFATEAAGEIAGARHLPQPARHRAQDLVSADARRCHSAA